MANNIHPTAIIEKGAIIGDNNTIFENVIIRKNVIIGNNNHIGPNSLLENIVNVGNSNKIYGFISIGTLGEMGLKGDTLPNNSEVFIGNNNVFREFITINFPVRKKKTLILNNCYFMARTHIPHDVHIGNNVVMATNSLIGGGCELNDYVYVGLNAHIHQWLNIGEGSLLGMSSATITNVPPFLIVVGIPSKIIKVNEEGLKRRNFSHNQISIFKKYISGEITEEIVDNELIIKHRKFINNHDDYLGK